MSVVALTVSNTSRAGLDLADDVAAGVDGNKWLNTGTELLYVNNASGGSITLTFTPTATVDGQAVTARTVAVGAGKQMLIGPFPVGVYNDANGYATVTYSAVTTLTVLAVKPATS